MLQVWKLVSFGVLFLVCSAMGQRLQGRVYEGTIGNENSPIANVTMRLYGSTDAGEMGSVILTATTDATGWYGFDVSDYTYEYYFIEEVNPDGYTSTGATSIDGVVLDDDHIRYEYPLSGKTLTGNKFWDEQQTSNTRPVADAGGPYSGTVGSSLTLDGSASYDPDPGDNIVSYQWDLDFDGQWDDATGATIQHTWNSVTSGKVGLLVTDTHGSKDSDEAQYSITEEDKAAIHGMKFHDLNANGIKDAGEPGLQGWTIYIDENNNNQLESNEYSTVTNINGNYQLTGLASGEYRVREILQTGWVITYPAFGYHLIQLSPGDTRNADFGNRERETEIEVDFGDAPMPYDSTAFFKVHSTFYVGTSVDADPEHQHHPKALGDDLDENDDEDGITLTSFLIPGKTSSLSATMVVSDIDEPMISIWIDVDQDGIWTLSERIVHEKATTGTHHYSFTLPQSVSIGRTFMRAILRDHGPAGPYGHYFGEVEDYEVNVVHQDDVFDFGDAPDVYETKYNWGPYHLIDQRFHLGSHIDSETDGHPSVKADGDDLDNSDDEDGISFSGFQAGSPATIQIEVAGPIQQTVLLAGWIDFDQNGSFDTDEVVINDHRVLSSSPQNITFTINVPASAAPGASYARFRIFVEEQFKPLPVSYGGIGEVEDYLVIIETPGDELDYGDAPLNFPSASHVIGDVYFGDETSGDGVPDAENSMQRTLDATGDDVNGYDDEEHNTFKFNVKGKAWWEWRAQVAQPKSSASGWMSFGLFIDWNQDGDWNDIGEQQTGGYGLVPWTKKMIIGLGTTLPSTAKSGKTIARVRLVDGYNSNVPPDGALGVGEVCDFEIDVTTGGDPLTDKGTIWGAKWHDVNGNGVWDGSEHGLAGWDIWLDANQNGVEDAGDLYDKTDSNGNYSFIGLKDGTYIVGEDLQPGWLQTYPGTITAPTTHSVKVDTSVASPPPVLFGNMEEQGDLDFGDAPSPYPSASHELGGPFLGEASTGAPDVDPGMQRSPDASGDDKDGNDDENSASFVYPKHVPGGPFLMDLSFTKQSANWLNIAGWVDLNQDGDWDDSGELFFAVGHPASWWAPTGYFKFYGAGMTIPKTARPGYIFIRMRIADDKNVTLTPDGHFGPGEVEDYAIAIEEGDIPDPVGGRIGGAKWHDLNKDGVWDAGEPALPGWLIYLDLNGNGMRDGTEPTSVTDSKGQFTFTNLKAGTYTVAEEQQPGWVQTFPAGGTHSIKVDPTKPLPGIAFGNFYENGDGMGALKWSQPPLFEPMLQDTMCYYGWDEISIYSGKMAADDWFCFNEQPVTGIRWWGSYENWQEESAPQIAPVEFYISIWTDVPKNQERDWSHPGELIWDAEVPREAVNEKMIRCDFHPEHMEHPETCFLYEWKIPESEWFYQQGDSTVYWLSIAAVYPAGTDIEYAWGWKTRMHYFNDDAVNVFFGEPIETGTQFRDGEPIHHTWDLAFELFTNEYEWKLDFGDAPNPGFGCSHRFNGAHHLVDEDIKLGQSIDFEPDGHPGTAADGDDRHNIDDDDGVQFLTDFRQGEEVKMQVELSASGFVSIWLDLDQNGHWFDAKDMIIDNAALPPGRHILDFILRDDAKIGDAMMRVRFATTPGLWFCGFAMNGEVEDYLVEIKSATITGQASKVPDQYKLYPNMPNPFNPSTRLKYDLPKNSSVHLSIRNALGQEIAVLVDEPQAAGHHTVMWPGLNENGQPVSAGIYFCILEAGDFRATQKLLFIK